jgi:hypothetical protein
VHRSRSHHHEFNLQNLALFEAGSRFSRAGFILQLADEVDLIVTQYGHAKGVLGRARSGYYKVAIIVAASIVEAAAHRLLELRLIMMTPDQMPFDDWECFDRHNLPASFSTDVNLAICKRRHPRFSLTKHTDFKRVNQVLLDMGVFTGPFFKRVERIREMRNKVHLQGLNHIGRKWTKADLNRTSAALESILRKISKTAAALGKI